MLATNGQITPLLDVKCYLVFQFTEDTASILSVHFTANKCFPLKPNSISIFPCSASPSYLNIPPILQPENSCFRLSYDDNPQVQKLFPEFWPMPLCGRCGTYCPYLTILQFLCANYHLTSQFTEKEAPNDSNNQKDDDWSQIDLSKHDASLSFSSTAQLFFVTKKSLSFSVKLEHFLVQSLFAAKTQNHVKVCEYDLMQLQLILLYFLWPRSISIFPDPKGPFYSHIMAIFVQFH